MQDKTINDISRKRLTGDSSWSIIAAIVNSFFGIGYLVVIGNYWGSEGLGVFALSVSVYLMGSLVFSVGIHQAVLYEVAASGEDKRRASVFVYTAFLSSLVLGVLGGIVGFIFSSLIAAAFHQPLMSNMVKVFAFAMPLFVVNKTALGILNAHRRMKLLAGVNVVRGGTILIFLIVAAILKMSFTDISYGFILAEVLVALLLLPACRRTHRFAMPSMQRAKCLISFGGKAALSGVIGDVNARMDILVIGVFWDASVVGVYSLASTLAKGLWLIPGAVQRVTNPLIVQLYSSGEKEKLHRTMDVLLRLGTALFVLVGFALIVFIRPLISLFYPEQPDMLRAEIPLFFLTPAVVITAGGVMVGSAVSTSIGMPMNALKSIWIMITVNLVFNLLLVPSLGGIGAATATAISLLAGLTYFRYLSKKYLDFEVPLTKLLLLFVVFCGIIAPVVMFESVASRFVLFVTGLVVIIAVLFAIKMVCKSDWILIGSVVKSFARLGQ